MKIILSCETSRSSDLKVDILLKKFTGAKRRRLKRLLTPEAFKKCLMRAQRRPKQKVDPVVYCDYYLLLEKTYKLYTDYEKRLLNKQLEQKAQELRQQSKPDSFDFPKIEISFQHSS